MYETKSKLYSWSRNLPVETSHLPSVNCRTYMFGLDLCGPVGEKMVSTSIFDGDMSCIRLPKVVLPSVDKQLQRQSLTIASYDSIKPRLVEGTFLSQTYDVFGGLPKYG